MNSLNVYTKAQKPIDSYVFGELASHFPHFFRFVSLSVRKTLKIYESHNYLVDKLL